MKTLIKVLLFFQFFLVYTFPQNVSPQFSELKGMEDAQGNTHLFYRIYSYESSGPEYYSETNNIYHMDLNTEVDTIFLYDGGYSDPIQSLGIGVSDYEFWNKDPSKYIYCGIGGNNYEFWGTISRFDFQNVRSRLFESYDNINISKQNDSLIYCAYPILKSNDGGFSWDVVNDSLAFLSLSPFNDQIYFANGPFYWWGGSYLYKTMDGGNTSSPVDTLGNSSFSFYYDSDGNHIYRKDLWSGSTVSLKRSSFQGNAFTWKNIYTAYNNFYLSLDESQSGAIYLADGKKIFYSSDYGNTFSLYKELYDRIIGIYKKPNSDKLYAATKYKIYEVTNGAIAIIKSLPIPEEILSYYPLKIGNKWVYKVTDWSEPYYGTYSEDIFTREVLSVHTMNNKEYFKIEEKWKKSAYVKYLYERIDKENGLIYRFDNECLNADSEKVIDHLISIPGDSVLNQRFTMCWDSTKTLFNSEKDSLIFNLSRKIRTYNYYSLESYAYTLVNGIGLYSVQNGYDFGVTNYSLNGYVIDGIVYGDTTITDVDDARQLPTEFRLNQNFPNPFNPNTKISWQTPVTGWQTLNVFDVLGNEVATLVNEYKPAGSYEVDFNASGLSSGVYFYRLQANSFVETKKMILLK